MTAARDTLADRLGRHLARKLNEPVPGIRPFTHANVAALRRVLQPGDVLLVEGNSRVSVAIKYLTQSTWSHAALYVGNAVGRVTPDGEPLSLSRSISARAASPRRCRSTSSTTPASAGRTASRRRTGRG